MAKRGRELMLEGPVGPTLARMTGPMVVAFFSTTLYAVVDAYFVGKLGSAQLSALGFVFPVVLVLTNVAMSVGLGAGARVAHALGEGATGKMRSFVSHGLGLGLTLSALLAVIGLLTLDPFFRRLGASDEVLLFVRQYMKVWYLGLPFLILPRVANAAIRSTGDTRTPMTVLLLAAALNALLDPLLIFGWWVFPRLEVAGAAWATLISRGLGLAISLAVLVRRGALLARWPRFEFGELRDAWRKILSIAVPASVSKLAFPVSMVAVTSLVASYGTAAVAAFGLSARIEVLLMVVVTALASSLLPFVGQNIGAAKLDRVRQGLGVSVRFALLWGGGLFLALLAGAPALVSFFHHDPEVVAISASYLRIVSLSFGLQGVTAMISAAFNAAHRPISASILTVVRMFGLYLPLAFLGNALWGLEGFFAGGCAGYLLAGAAAWLWGRSVFSGPARKAGGAGAPSPSISLLGVLVLLGAAGSARAQGFDLRGFETFSIMEIQSTVTFSPLTGQRLETSGVVTLWTSDRTGFWIQDPAGDGDPDTSDGLFVDLGKEPRVEARPAVGDLVRLIGTVEEDQRGIELPRTVLRNLILLEILESGRELPPPVPLVNLPDRDLDDAIAFWEALEGMRVRLGEAVVIAPTARFGEFVVLAAADAVAGSGYFPEKGVMLMRNVGRDRVDYNPERIIVGDETLEEPVLVRPGDRVVSLAGVVDYTFGRYKVQPENVEVVKQEAPRAPFSVRSGPPGDFKITAYNLRDLFDTVDNPERFDENFDPGSGRRGPPSAEELEIRLEKHALAIVQELELPDIIVSVEFETTELFQDIGNRVNAKAGTRYRAVSLETSDRRGLEVGFLFDEARVEHVEHYQMSGPEVEKAFGLTSAFRTREPLVGVFRPSAGGAPVTLVACKFKSKRIEPSFWNLNDHHYRVTENQRKVQARVVRDFVSSILAKDPGARVVVAGDLGDMEFVEPGEGVSAVGILEGTGGEIPLRNVIELEDEGDVYTWLYYGNGQALSHILVSPALFERLVAADVLHFNAVFSDIDLRFDVATPLRASDRDPIEARFKLSP